VTANSTTSKVAKKKPGRPAPVVPKRKPGRPATATKSTETKATGAKRGRPKATTTASKTATPATPAKKRGRPAGSKNTSKKITPTTTRRRGRPAASTAKKVTSAKKTSPAKRGRKSDDLKLIEGVGPKMEEALRNAGFKTFAKIATSNPDKLKAVLVKANSRFGIAATESWPTQAKMATKGAFEELKAFQDTLNRGR